VRNAVIVATGRKGSGKTTMVRALVANCRRAIFADPEAKWPLRPGDVEARGESELRAALDDVGAADPGQPFGIVYRDDAEAMKVAAPAWAFGFKNLTLVVDELAWLCTPWSLPVYLKRLLQFGRERRVNVVGTTRVPQEIHDLFFSSADWLLVFHTDPGNGLDRLRVRYPGLAAAAPRLGPFQYLSYRSDPDFRADDLLGREGLKLGA
jgi:hypothetical protein